MRVFGFNISRQAAVAMKSGKQKAGTPDGLWIRTGGAYRWTRDANSADVYTNCNRAYGAWKYNPFVRRITNMFVDHVVGEGIEFIAKDEKVQEYAVNPFLSANHVHTLMKKRARELYLYGELAANQMPNLITGNLRIGFIDPVAISEIKYSELDGDTPISLRVSTSGGTLELLIVRIDDDGSGSRLIPEFYGDKRPESLKSIPLNTVGKRVGRAIYHPMNSMLGAQRGSTDLIPIMDPCAMLEDMLWQLGKRIREESKTYGVITIEGAKPSELTDYRDAESANYIPPPGEEGEWVYANEKIKYENKTVAFGASEIIPAIKELYRVIEVGGGPPQALFGDTATSTYASAKEAANPFVQMMISGQREFCNFWQEQIDFAVDTKRIFSKQLDGVTDFSVTVKPPQISPEDDKMNTEIGKMQTDMVVAWRTSNMINDMQAIDMMTQIAKKTGLTVKQVEQQIVQQGADATIAWAQEALKRISESAEK